MSLRRTLWLLTAAIVIHNAEELPKMVAYAKRRGWEMSETQWRVALALMTVIMAGTSVLAARRPDDRLRLHLGLMIPSALALNAVDHARQTIQYRDYSPGTATGIGLSLPLSVYLYVCAIREGRTSTKGLALAAGAGPVILGGMLFASHAAGKLVARLLDDRE